MLKLGFFGSLSQLVGFTMGIYVIYDWNEMEPYTWIICKLIIELKICNFVFLLPISYVLTFFFAHRIFLSHGRIILLPLVAIRLGLHFSLRWHEKSKVELASQVRGIWSSTHRHNESLCHLTWKATHNYQRKSNWSQHSWWTRWSSNTGWTIRRICHSWQNCDWSKAKKKESQQEEENKWVIKRQIDNTEWIQSATRRLKLKTTEKVKL